MRTGELKIVNDYTRKKIYKFKKYPHFDPKIHWKNVYRLVESSEYISKHSFYPFIHYSQKSYKFPKSYLEGTSETRGIPLFRIMEFLKKGKGYRELTSIKAIQNMVKL